MSVRRLLLPLSLASVLVALVACEGDSTGGGSSGVIPSEAGFVVDSSSSFDGAGPAPDAAIPIVDASDAADAAKVLPDGMLGPIPYLSRADSPFKGVALPSYSHFEDFEDHLLNTPGVASDSPTLSASFGAALIDSVDGDDGTIDGKCTKIDGTCDALFGNGSVTLTFDAAVLGALPTYVGLVWTDGNAACDATFDAYDAADVLIGTRTAAAVGDGDNSGGPGEDRFFGVVHAAGVKKIVMKSSAGGVEVDHLTYGR